MRKYIKIFFSLARQRQFMLIEVFVLLGVFKLVIMMMNFKRVEPHLGQHMYETSHASDAQEIMIAKEVAWAVKTMSRHTFWESKCLVQAMTAKYMLRRRGMKSTLYLGLARDENQEMIAHAWLRSGDKIVTGEKTKEKFVTISSFGDV